MWMGVFQVVEDCVIDVVVSVLMVHEGSAIGYPRSHFHNERC